MKDDKTTQTGAGTRPERHPVCESAEDIRRRRRREDIELHIKDIILYIVFGILGMFPFWGWILFGWLFEQFH